MTKTLGGRWNWSCDNNAGASCSEWASLRFHSFSKPQKRQEKDGSYLRVIIISHCGGQNHSPPRDITFRIIAVEISQVPSTANIMSLIKSLWKSSLRQTGVCENCMRSFTSSSRINADEPSNPFQGMPTPNRIARATQR